MDASVESPYAAREDEDVDRLPNGRQVNTAFAALVLALVLNGAALIWGAAKLSATVDTVKETVAQLNATLSQVGSSVQNLRERVIILEDRGNRVPGDPRSYPRSR